eukprot:maker-scaffold592_size129239-snap-gene-0.21 protein:Tk10859 transcript:maker-scaffold592_size129239-snap-gene-0.21-mRNA-1 annotation:"wd repeat-containing protein 44-like"
MASSSAGRGRVESGSSSSEEFYDATDQTPGKRSRGNSLKRGLSLPSPIITITAGSPSRDMVANLARTKSNRQHNDTPEEPSSNFAVPNSHHSNPMVLPEEIARELEEISKTDAERRRRLARLQRLQQDGDRYSDYGDDEDMPSSAAAMLEEAHLVGNSTESSVDGIYVEQKSHPFKVIEPDTRSTASETRSGRIPGGGGDSVSLSRESTTRPDELYSEESGTLTHLSRNLSGEVGESPPASVLFQSSAVVPDIVSSIQTDYSASVGPIGKPLSSASSTATVSKASVECMPPPSRPPRKKRQSLTQFLTSSSGPAAGSGFTFPPTQLPPTLPLLPSEPPYVHENSDSPALSPITRPSTLITSTPTTRLQGDGAMASSSGIITFKGHNPVLPSPASTVESLTREFENSLRQQQQQLQQQPPHPQQAHQSSLSLLAAMRGQYVVRPQDNEESRAGNRFSYDELGSRVPSPPEERSPPLVMGEGAIPKIGQPKISREESYHSLHSPPFSSSFADQATVIAATNPPERGASGRLGSMGSRRSFKSMISGSGSGGRRSSSSGGGNGVGGAVGAIGIGIGPSSSLGSSKGGSAGKRSSMGVGGSSSMESAPGSISNQVNNLLRTKSDSGQRYSEEDILKQIKVKNLDTGEEMDLMQAEDQLPPSINPLSLYIMRLTSEYVSGEPPCKDSDSDSESLMSSVSGHTIGSKKKKSSTMKKLFGEAIKKTSDAARTLASEATRRRTQQKDNLASTSSAKDMEKLGRFSTDINSPREGGRNQTTFKRIQAHKSGPFDFESIQFAQELATQHLGPIWCMRFSQCGQLLATAGKDTILRIWVLKSSYNYFKDMRARYNADGQKSSPTNSFDVIADQEALFNVEDKRYHVFNDRPFCSYQGHTSDVLDICWSKNYFILTSSMDKTVRLWHISRRECLCCFQHIDFVTALAFHPRNDQFFLSGSLDGKLRLWNIPDKKVSLWNEVDGNTKIITAANFIQNGKFAVAGTYDGRCIFYSTDQLKYYTMIHVRSTRGKNSQGRKVTGIEPMPGEDKILVTSNDSRIRIYDLRDLSLTCKFKGFTNNSSQIRATFR